MIGITESFMNKKTNVREDMAVNKKWVVYLVALFGLSAFDALAIKANIGVAPLEAMQVSFSELSSIKVGTIAIMINFVFIIMQIVLLKKEFKRSQYLQFFISFLSGFMVNLWLYDVYRFPVNSYWVRIGLLLLSYLGSTFFLGIVVSLDLITMSLEAFCMAFSRKKNISFSKIRQIADVVNTVISVLLSLLFHLGFAVREGSVLAMLIYAPILGYFMKKETPILKKYGLLSDRENAQVTSE